MSKGSGAMNTCNKDECGNSTVYANASTFIKSNEIECGSTE